MLENKIKPATGFAGFKENVGADALAGFLVSLIALPLSLGIASAYGFPPIMGVLTAIIGGIVVSFFAGSELTIKGPAAGLIVIVAGAVEELGKGNNEVGWHLTLGVIVVAAVIQIIFGITKVANFSDFFPLSVVHGMLAAIGIIIFSKQIHFALGINPALLKGKGPVELLGMIPQSLTHFNPHIALIGVVSLVILFGMPMIKNKFVKKIPPALIVLILGIVFTNVFNLGSDAYKDLKPLINPGSLSFNLNVDFSGIYGENTGIFIKYVAMFALIGSLESILTGKAVDLLDPYKRKANLSKDLTAVGIGNAISGILGGSSMISEVARSSANITNGAKTRWANFWHGIFLLLFVLALTPLIKMVPMAALAAMLIAVGYRLASPKEFIHILHIGKEQLMIFVVTIIATLMTDLLVGIGTGILVKFLFELINGVPFNRLFKARVETTAQGDTTTVKVMDAAVFSNYLSLKSTLTTLPKQKHIIVDFSQCKLVDHTVLENVHELANNYNADGGTFEIAGIDALTPLSDHPHAVRKATK